MSVADQANAVADHWDGHPGEFPQGATQVEQAQYNQEMTAWNDKFGAAGPPDPPEPPAIPGSPSPGAGLPAARIGDLRAHGGKITGPGLPRDADRQHPPGLGHARDGRG